MKRNPIRSTIFNIMFFVLSVIICVALIPTLALPRHYFLSCVHGWLLMVAWLEEHVLGLSYEVRGAENLPEGGSYIIAAKHQSAYETFKLRLLFDDPAIILKQELLRIPLWGQYLKKTDVIAIDRSSPKKATESIRTGALHVMEQGRPILIFPQGTRVRPDETAADKPYKTGVHRIQHATGLPIIPLALNSGMFWPRSGWLKSSGTVVFEFLPPVKDGMGHRELTKHLEVLIEDASNKLMDEARDKQNGF